MMNTLRLVSRRNLHQLRQFHKCVACRTEVTATLEKPVSPKIDKLVNDITALNLIEVAELSEVLKIRLNLPDTPMMPVGGFAVAAKVEEEEETAQAPKKVQTAFTIKLTGFDEKKKVALIKEIKNLLPDTNLVQAKKFVESAPVVIMADIAKDEAEKIKDIVTQVGGQVEIS